MTNEQIRIKIAESLGWKKVKDFKWNENGKIRLPKHWVSSSDLPNYPEDLNACAEFEKALEGFKYGDYLIDLGCFFNDSGFGGHREQYSAAAPQRCEAYLRTIGKWEA